MKSLSTTKLYNVLRSTTFILAISSSEIIYKIWISNFNTSNIFLYDKIISNKKVFNYKVHNILRPTTFILIIFPSNQNLKFKRSFAWQYDFK
jgi:hypothetical protein